MRSTRFDRRALHQLGCTMVGLLGCTMPHAYAQSVPWTTTYANQAIDQAIDKTRDTYSLQDLIRLALAISPRNKQAQEQALQAHLASTLVKSRYAPQLNVKALGGNEHTPLAITRNVSPRGYIVSSSREIIPSLQLKWLLFDFGRRKGQLEEARQTARAADSDLMGEQQQLVFDVSKAYFDTASAQGKVRAARKALDAARLMEQAIADQRHHGRATLVQLAEAHRQSAAAQLALTRICGDADTAFASLLATVGLPPDSRFELSPPDIPDAGKNPLPALKSLIDQAMQSRPDVLAAQSKVAAASARIDAAHAAYHPTISIQAQVFQNIGKTSSNGSPYSTIDLTGNSVFVAFELPLFDGGERATNVSIAVSQHAQTEDALDETKLAATQQVIQSYNELKTSLDNRAQAIAYTHAAELAYQAALDAYKHGLSDVTELTNNDAALAQAESGEEDANAQVLIGLAAVAFATGQRTPY